MPQIGEIQRARNLGYKGNDRRIWALCSLCGEGRWTILKNGKPEHPRCRRCALRDRSGNHNHNWQGGRYKTVDGYVKIYKPRYPNGDKWGYILEHRYLVEQRIGRYLTGEEVVHHLINLLVLATWEHNTLIRAYQEKIRILEVAIEKLIDEEKLHQ